MTRRILQLLAVLFYVLAVMLALAACYHIGAAHASVVTTDGVASPVVLANPSPALPWEAWAALAIAALGSLRGIVHGLRELVGLFAKRTKTTIDDNIEGALGKVDDALTEALGAVRSIAGKAGPTVLLVMLLGAVALAPACGGSQSSRHATISALDSGVRVAVTALRAYEHAKADAAINAATSLEQGKAALAAVRAKTAPAWKAVDAAIGALDAANTLNNDTSLTGAATALNNAIAAIAALTGGAP